MIYHTFATILKLIIITKRNFMKFYSLFISFFMLSAISLVGQKVVSVGGSLGWAVPGGSGVSEKAEDLNLDGGLTYTGDVLYHIKPNVGVGLGYTGSILAGGGDGDIDVFGMRLIGAKARYALKAEGFTPYASLTLGLAQLLTPELTVTDGTGQTVVIPENNGSGFGIMPEIGLSFGAFFINAQYIVPTKFTVEEAQIKDKAVGTLNIGIGYRYNFEF